MIVQDLRTRTKVLIVSAGVLGMAGLSLGAANAATPATPAPVIAGALTTDIQTPGDVADAPGAVEEPEAADAQDSPEAPGDPGPNAEQTGDHTDPGDAPGSP